MTKTLTLNKIFDSFRNISLDEIKEEYPSSFAKVLNIQRNWLCPIEDKLSLLNDTHSENSFKSIIEQLKDEAYSFSEKDIDSLGLFIKKIDSISNVANFINNFKQGSELKNGILIDLPKLFNAVKNSETVPDLIERLGGKIHNHLENLFSIIKHCQSPLLYPVNYPFWRNMSKEFFGISENYDSLCSFYRTFPTVERHLNFGVFLGTIATEISNQVNNSEIAKSTDSKEYKKLIKLFHIPEYKELIQVSLTFKEKILSEFEQWLSSDYRTKNNKHLSKKSVKNYLDGIITTDKDIKELKLDPNGLLYENGITNVLSLVSIYQETPMFLERNKTGKNMYSNAISLFVSFIDTKTTLTEKTYNNIMNIPSLNQILYGPPGTGKTYNTINKALEAIGEPIDNMNREQIKKRFDELVAEKRIVFTTFHQSLSYEDFVEGLKPSSSSDSDDIKYKVENGIFKEVALRASLKEYKSVEILGEKKELTKEVFKELYRNLSDSLSDTKSQISTVILETKEGNQFGLFRNSTGSIVVRPLLGKTDMSVAHKQLEAVLFENKPPTYSSYERPVINKILDGQNISSEKVDNIEKNYVIIIDEINRGNVSQIFGELITLIEKDKRKPTRPSNEQTSEHLTVILPYSKTEFSVPDNLYIIGTMNTADRSVEALDSALRRRFVFEEMKPMPEKIPEIRMKKGLEGKINDINLETLLTTINNRIEKLLDRDHAVGHSYFLDCRNIKELKDTFYKNIIPLLQEYFYGDYAKIGLVLGAGFVKIKESKNIAFATFDHDSIDIFNDRKLYEIVDYRNGAEHTIQLKKTSYKISFEGAISLLLGNEIDTVNAGQE